MIMISTDMGDQYFNGVNKNIQDLAKNVKATSGNTMQPLKAGYQPGAQDVICARGKKAHNHAGNKRFRKMVHDNLENYSQATTKLSKSLIVSSIVDAVRQSSPDGGFIKEEGGEWFEVGDHIAREKVGQSFRDLLHNQYKSSTKAKKQRRKEQDRQKMDEAYSKSKARAKLMAEAEEGTGASSVAEKIEMLAANQDHMEVKNRDSFRMNKLFNQANNELLQQIKSTQGDGSKDENDGDVEPVGFEEAVAPIPPPPFISYASMNRVLAPNVAPNLAPGTSQGLEPVKYEEAVAPVPPPPLMSYASMDRVLAPTGLFRQHSLEMVLPFSAQASEAFGDQMPLMSRMFSRSYALQPTQSAVMQAPGQSAVLQAPAVSNATASTSGGGGRPSLLDDDSDDESAPIPEI